MATLHHSGIVVYVLIGIFFIDSINSMIAVYYLFEVL